jgi:hypothetical protein
MKDINTKYNRVATNDGVFTAEEFNSIYSELKNLISTILSVDGTDEYQILKAIDTVGRSNFYVDTTTVTNLLKLQRLSITERVEQPKPGTMYVFTPKNVKIGGTTLKVNNWQPKNVLYAGEPVYDGFFDPKELYVAILRSDTHFDIYQMSFEQARYTLLSDFLKHVKTYNERVGDVDNVLDEIIDTAKKFRETYDKRVEHVDSVLETHRKNIASNLVLIETNASNHTKHVGVYNTFVNETGVNFTNVNKRIDDDVKDLSDYKITMSNTVKALQNKDSDLQNQINVNEQDIEQKLTLHKQAYKTYTDQNDVINANQNKRLVTIEALVLPNDTAIIDTLAELLPYLKEANADVIIVEKVNQTISDLAALTKNLSDNYLTNTSDTMNGNLLIRNGELNIQNTSAGYSTAHFKIKKIPDGGQIYDPDKLVFYAGGVAIRIQKTGVVDFVNAVVKYKGEELDERYVRGSVYDWLPTLTTVANDSPKFIKHIEGRATALEPLPVRGSMFKDYLRMNYDFRVEDGFMIFNDNTRDNPIGSSGGSLHFFALSMRKNATEFGHSGPVIGSDDLITFVETDTMLEKIVFSTNATKMYFYTNVLKVTFDTDGIISETAYAISSESKIRMRIPNSGQFTVADKTNSSKTVFEVNPSGNVRLHPKYNSSNNSTYFHFVDDEWYDHNGVATFIKGQYSDTKKIFNTQSELVDGNAMDIIHTSAGKHVFRTYVRNENDFELFRMYQDTNTNKPFFGFNYGTLDNIGEISVSPDEQIYTKNLLSFKGDRDDQNAIGFRFVSSVNPSSDMGYIAYYPNYNFQRYSGVTSVTTLNNSKVRSALVIGTQNDFMDTNKDIMIIRSSSRIIFDPGVTIVDKTSGKNTSDMLNYTESQQFNDHGDKNVIFNNCKLVLAKDTRSDRSDVEEIVGISFGSESTHYGMYVVPKTHSLTYGNVTLGESVYMNVKNIAFGNYNFLNEPNLSWNLHIDSYKKYGFLLYNMDSESASLYAKISSGIISLNNTSFTLNGRDVFARFAHGKKDGLPVTGTDKLLNPGYYVVDGELTAPPNDRIGSVELKDVFFKTSDQQGMFVVASGHHTHGEKDGNTDPHYMVLQHYYPKNDVEYFFERKRFKGLWGAWVRKWSPAILSITNNPPGYKEKYDDYIVGLDTIKYTYEHLFNDFIKLDNDVRVDTGFMLYSEGNGDELNFFGLDLKYNEHYIGWQGPTIGTRGSVYIINTRKLENSPYTAMFEFHTGYGEIRMYNEDGEYAYISPTALQTSEESMSFPSITDKIKIKDSATHVTMTPAGITTTSNTFVLPKTETSSSIRYKTDVIALQYGLKDIMQLQPKKYLKNDIIEFGLIAEEVIDVIPEIVVIRDINGEERPDGLLYTELIPVLINSVKEQQQIINDQAKKIEEQQIQIDELNKKLNEVLSVLNIE